MKYILILLIIFPFLSQAQVEITNEVADYYLELHDKYKIQNGVIEKQKVTVGQLKFQIITQQSITNSCMSEVVTFNSIIATKDDQLAFKDKENKLAKKEIRKQKLHKVLIVAAVVVEHVVIIAIIIL